MRTLPQLDREVAEESRSFVGRRSMHELPERAVQFGTGAFLRGFVDDFLHRANQHGFFDGRVVAIGSTGSSRDQALREQDGLYTLVVRGLERGEVVDERRIISSLSRALSAADDWDAVLELARSPELRFVFSNTTEVGIVANDSDSFDDAPPSSFPAKLTRFLFERARAFGFAGHGLVVIPCELIEHNGAKLRDIVLALAGRWALDARFSEWLAADVRFCNTLVDRIVPGVPTGADAEELAAELGYGDALLTCCEPYRLFAIEGDATLRAMLPWAKADPAIIIEPDISPYRARKLYLLNGAHTLFVSAALLLGNETVAESMEKPELMSFVRRAMFDEIVPTLNVAGAEEFAEAVIDRFRNPFIRHALIDITLQATMKMRLRVIPSLQRFVAQRGKVPQALTFGFAAFLMLKREPLRRPDDQGAPIVAAWERHGEDHVSLVEEVCGNASLWGSDLAALPGVTDAVIAHLEAIRSHGIKAAFPTTN
jgi:tagaturonate reductase